MSEVDCLLEQCPRNSPTLPGSTITVECAGILLQIGHRFPVLDDTCNLDIPVCKIVCSVKSRQLLHSVMGLTYFQVWVASSATKHAYLQNNGIRISVMLALCL